VTCPDCNQPIDEKRKIGTPRGWLYPCECGKRVIVERAKPAPEPVSK